MNIENEIKQKSRGQLIDIADKLKIPIQQNATADVIAQHILQQPDSLIVGAISAETKKADIKIGHENSVEDVKKAIARHAEKDGFIAEFPGDGTWIFSYRGCEESGNLNIPLRSIVQRAEFVSKGRRALQAYGQNSGFDQAVAKGYTNTVLM